MMNNISALILQQAGLKTSYFTPGSRYHGIETGTIQVGDMPVPYVRRRFIPPPERFLTIQEHTVSQNERIDLLSNQYLGDPEQFWRICDANVVVHPDELTNTLGKQFRITLPDGMISI
jgi:hypothetical protein